MNTDRIEKKTLLGLAETSLGSGVRLHRVWNLVRCEV